MPVGVVFQAIRPPRARPLIVPLRSKLDRFAKRAAQDVVATVSKYPPVPADSRYERTYNLLGAWQITPESTTHDVRWVVRNSLKYANLVHGTPQWLPHQWHGWRDLGEVVASYASSGRFVIGAQAIMTDAFSNWYS